MVKPHPSLGGPGGSLARRFVLHIGPGAKVGRLLGSRK